MSALSPPLAQRIDRWLASGEPPGLDATRRAVAQQVRDWVSAHRDRGEAAHLVFVCTHNSRRSHIGQLWAQAIAIHLGLHHVTTWSGGTEDTAFNPRSVTALRGDGFQITETGEVLGDINVVYHTVLGPDLPAVRSFSKAYDDAFNPQQDFAAILVCTEADEACPFVLGATLRLTLPYLDPKASDGTPEEAATYAAKSEEIGREWAWILGGITP